MTSKANESSWTVILEGAERPLIPSQPALAAIERRLKRSIFSLVDSGKTEGFTLDELEVILAGLVPADPAHMIFAKARTSIEGGIRPTPSLQPAIVEAGIMRVSALVLMPLVAALSGLIDAGGNRRAED